VGTNQTDVNKEIEHLKATLRCIREVNNRIIAGIGPSMPVTVAALNTANILIDKAIGSKSRESDTPASAEEDISGRCLELVVYFVTGAACSGILLDADLDTYHIERKMKTLHPIRQWLEEGHIQEKDLREWIKQAVSVRVTDLWTLAEEARRDRKTSDHNR